ncbi:hypothetical protein ACM66B_004227 [Microbotryomycetes sp. NB124-2]
MTPPVLSLDLPTSEMSSDDEKHDHHHRHGLRKRVRRKLHHAHERLKRGHKRVKAYRKRKLHEGHHVEKPSKRTTIIVCCVVSTLMIGFGLLVYFQGWWEDWFADIKDFVIFPELKKPFDVEEAFKSGTSIVGSVATSLASEARQVVDKAAEGAKDAANDVKDFFKGIGKRDEFGNVYLEAIATTSWTGAVAPRATRVAVEASRPTLGIAERSQGRARMHSSCAGVAVVAAALWCASTTNAAVHDRRHHGRDSIHRVLIKKRQDVPLVAKLALPGTLDRSEATVENKTTDATGDDAPKAWHTGEALWFNQTGAGTGACKQTHSNDDLVFGLSATWYGPLGAISPHCGRLVEVEHADSGKTLTLPVTDSSGNEYFTLSVQAFRQFAPLRTGLLDIKWRFVGESSSPVTGGSNSTAVGSGNSTTSARPAGPSAVSTATITSVASRATSDKSTKTTSVDTESVASAREAQESRASVSSARAAAASKEAAEERAAASSSAAAAAASASAAAERKEREAEEARKKAEREERERKEAAERKARQEAEEAERRAQEEADRKAAERKAREEAERKAREDAERTAREEAERKAKEEADRKAREEAEAAKNNGGGGGGNVIRGGYATYYLQNGNYGIASDSDKVVALPSAVYQGGSNCGRQVRITRVSDGRSVVATVRDSCPTCVNAQSLDLSVGAFQAIAAESEGMVEISYTYL